MKITRKIPVGDKLFTTVLLLITGLMLLILPSVSVKSLMNGTQSGKTILFTRLKIESTAIKEIKAEMEEIILKDI